MTVAQRRRLTAVARGAAPADLYVRGGTLLNVYTGEIYPANVAIAGERIAYVGLRDDMVGPRTRTLDAGGRVLMPGYIDPHVHPAHVVTPSGLARHLLPLGTTTVFADSLQIWELGGLRAFRVVADALARSPLKFYWMIRVHAQARTTDEPRRFPLRRHRARARPSVDVRRRRGHPLARRVGRQPRLARAAWTWRWRAGSAWKATPPAPPRTRSPPSRRAASPPTTSRSPPARCWTARVRASRSCCANRRCVPTSPACSTRSRTAPALASRLMLTADGSMPAFIRDHGFVDHLIRVAMKRGVAPVDAYRMATLNPATYIGREADLGGVAPGRYADLCLLRDLGEPRPEVVVARGRIAARDGRVLVPVPEPDWSRALATPEARLTVRWRARPEDFRLPRARSLPGHPARERRDHATGRAAAGRGRSARRAGRSRRALGGAGRGDRLRRSRRRPGLHDHDRLQHPRAGPAPRVDGAGRESPARGSWRCRARGRGPRELRAADAARRRDDASELA